VRAIERLNGLAAGDEGDQVTVAGGDGGSTRTAPPATRERGIAIADRNARDIARQLSDGPLRAAARVQALQVGGQSGQQCARIRCGCYFVAPGHRDPVPVVAAGLGCALGAEHHDRQSQPDELSPFHVVYLLRGG
jgi:hypothetical protein